MGSVAPSTGARTAPAALRIILLVCDCRRLFQLLQKWSERGVVDAMAGGFQVRTSLLVIAELDEGPWWWSQLADGDPAGLTVGTRLRLAFARPDEPGHEAVPVFERPG